MPIKVTASNSVSAQPSPRRRAPRLPRRLPLTAFLIFFVGSCAATAPTASRPSGLDQTGRLFARVYDQIADLYVEPVASGTLAVAAVKRLSTVDPQLSVSREPGFIQLAMAGGPPHRFPTPRDDDSAAWGAVTSAVLQASKAESQRIAATPEEVLHQQLIEGIITSLDRFSRYAGAETAREQRAARDGFGGIGVTLDYEQGDVRVVSILPESPAARAGVKAEDRITEIDGVTTTGLPRLEVVRKLRGPIDSRVALTLARTGSNAPIRVTLARALIVVPTVTTKFEDGIVVFRVANFNHLTAQTLREQLLKVRQDHADRVRGIVLDLRGNPGGLLDQAVHVADFFLTSGPIVSTRGRHPASLQFFNAIPDELAGGLPVVVLINGGSASAAEIVAAALQDRGRAILIGSASYGKGTVQTVLRLPNDGELTLTWAKLISPGGYALHEHGVVPSICTGDLSDDDRGVAAAIARGTILASASGIAGRPRVSLDNAAWSELRKSCTAQSGERELDVKIAKRLLADPVLYTRAIHASPPNVAASEPAR